MSDKKCRPQSISNAILAEELLQDDAVRAIYDELEVEFAIARAMIRERQRLGLTQAELADRMGKKQSYIARIESGKHGISTTTLKNFGKATGTVPKIKFVKASKIRRPKPVKRRRDAA